MGRSMAPLHGGDLRRAAALYGSREFIDFSANINLLGPPPQVLRVLAENLKDVIHYPDPHLEGLKEDLGAFLEVDPPCILPGNGGAELIYLLPRLEGVRQVLISTPTFSEYAAAAKASKVPVRYRPDFDHLRQGDMLFLCNPNNPTGRFTPKDQVLQLARKAEKRGAWLVVDEAFIDFTPEGRAASAAPLVGDFKRLIVVYSLTKLFAIPGLRLGCLVAPPGLIRALGQLQPPWSVNFLAELAGRTALQDESFRERTRQATARQREFLYRGLLAQKGLRPYPSAANFIFITIDDPDWTGTTLTDAMGRRGILIRNCASFHGLEGDRHIRVAVRTQRENERLLAELADLLGGIR